MSGRVNRHNRRMGEPSEHERGSPKANVFTAMHLRKAPFSVPIIRSQWTFSFMNFLQDEIYASTSVHEDIERRAQARYRKDVFKN